VFRCEVRQILFTVFGVLYDSYICTLHVDDSFLVRFFSIVLRYFRELPVFYTPRIRAGEAVNLWKHIFTDNFIEDN